MDSFKNCYKMTLICEKEGWNIKITIKCKKT